MLPCCLHDVDEASPSVHPPHVGTLCASRLGQRELPVLDKCGHPTGLVGAEEAVAVAGHPALKLAERGVGRLAGRRRKKLVGDFKPMRAAPEPLGKGQQGHGHAVMGEEARLVGHPHVIPQTEYAAQGLLPALRVTL